MPSIFGDQHVGDHRLGRQPALDQPFRRRRHNHSLLARPAGIFGTVRHDHPELRWDHVETPRSLFADDMHRRAATGAVGVFRRDRHIDMRQMGGKRATIGATLVAAPSGGGRILLVIGGFIAGDGLLDIFQGQKQLLGIELLRAPTELRTLQLAQQMPQAIDLRQRLVALGNGRVALGARCRYQHLQRFDVGWKLGCDLAHARHSIRFARRCGTRRAA
jgi:hypothetical protein